jgi:hypothetical protein
MREYLRDLQYTVRTRSLETYRGINQFKKGYQPRNNLVKYENGDLLADSHILHRWKNYFPQPSKVDRVSVVRQTEIHTAEPLVPEQSQVYAAWK